MVVDLLPKLMVQKRLQCERLLAYRNRCGQKTYEIDSMIDEFCAEAPDLEGFLFIVEGHGGESLRGLRTPAANARKLCHLIGSF